MTTYIKSHQDSRFSLSAGNQLKKLATLRSQLSTFGENGCKVSG